MAVAHAVSAIALLTRIKNEAPLTGTKNGVNRVFAAPEFFVPTAIDVFHNGRRMTRSGVEAEIEYEVSESGGLGTGFDTVTFVTAPIATSVLRMNYIAAA